MIISHTLNAATKLLLILAPLVFVSGCASLADPSSPGSQTAARLQAEPAPDRLVRYCRRMAETNNLRIAIGICERALAAAPDNPEPVIILADAYRDADHSREAAEAYRFALNIDQQNGKAHFELGKLYLKDSRLEDARPHLEAALANGQQDPAIFNALGVLEDQTGNHSSAQAFYQAGLALDPDNSALANNLGISVLLSKPSEIGNDIFGHLPSEEQPSARPEPKQLLQKSAAAPRIASDQSPPAAQKAAKSLAPVPDLTQTSQETLLDFFGDSRRAELDVTAPLVTAAPVTIVDFQALPPHPAPAAMAINPDKDSDTALARALLDYNPTQIDRLEGSTMAAARNSDAKELPTPTSQSVDLAKIKPARKPIVAPGDFDEAPDIYAPVLANSDEAESTSRLQLAMVPHLPIEMPVETNHPLSEEKGELKPVTPVIATTQAKIETEADALNASLTELHVIEVSGPHHINAVSTYPHGMDEILTDVILPSESGLVLLQEDAPLNPFAAQQDPGWVQFATLYDGLPPTERPSPQDISHPDSDQPGSDPILWPDGVAELRQTSNRPPGPGETEDIPIALMLLHRSTVSTA